MKDRIRHSVVEMRKYNAYSNPTYLKKERKNNLFLDNTIDYFVFCVPLTLISVFILNKLFGCLFNFEISKYLRPYSFLLITFELLIQNYVEQLTFLGFRNIQVSFSFSLAGKMMQVLGIFMLFLIVLAVASSYFLYLYKYGKLAKYFLANLFRFPSSYALMIIMYGIRPFLKGVSHAILYEY